MNCKKQLNNNIVDKNVSPNNRIKPFIGNLSLCSRSRNFKELFFLDNLHKKINNCCLKFDEFFKLNGELVLRPIICDNRSCENNDCKDHRGMKFKKKHQHQIDKINNLFDRPKTWVFTVYSKLLHGFEKKVY
jgi:hypothetical protein